MPQPAPAPVHAPPDPQAAICPPSAALVSTYPQLDLGPLTEPLLTGVGGAQRCSIQAHTLLDGHALVAHHLGNRSALVSLASGQVGSASGCATGCTTGRGQLPTYGTRALPVNRVRATHICPKLQTPLTSFPARGRQPTLPTSRPQPSLALLLPKPRSSPCRGAGGQQDPLASSITAGGPPEHQHPATTPRSASPRASWSTQQQTRDFLLLYSQLTAVPRSRPARCPRDTKQGRSLAFSSQGCTESALRPPPPSLCPPQVPASLRIHRPPGNRHFSIVSRRMGTSPSIR